MIPAQLPATDTQLADFCRKHHIRRLSFFGSVLRSDFRPDSDIDALVEFEPGHTPGFSIYDIEQELSQLLCGHPVDLVNPKFLNRRLKQTVLNSAELVYEGRRNDGNSIIDPSASKKA